LKILADDFHDRCKASDQAHSWFKENIRRKKVVCASVKEGSSRTHSDLAEVQKISGRGAPRGRPDRSSGGEKRKKGYLQKGEWRVGENGLFQIGPRSECKDARRSGKRKMASAKGTGCGEKSRFVAEKELQTFGGWKRSSPDAESETLKRTEEATYYMEGAR